MNIPVYGQTYRKLGVVTEMLKVYANTIPSMAVRVNEGSCFINKQLVEFSGGTVTLVIPTVNSYIAAIGLRNSQISVLYGPIASNNPELPSFPNDFIILAAVVLRSSDTMITDDMIQDLRPFFETTTTISNHSELEGLDEENIHPIASITGLQDALDKKIEMSDVTDKLNDIAKADGTTSATFTLNSAAVGVPTENITMIFKRGAEPDAAIRFNEQKDQFEFDQGTGEWQSLVQVLKDDPFNQENLYWKSDIDTMIQSLKAAIAQKANASDVAELKITNGNYVTQEYVDNKFLNIYTKQKLDELAMQMEAARDSVVAKVNRTEVYVKEEADQLHEELKNELDSKITGIESDLNDVKIDIESEIKPSITSLSEDLNSKFQTTQEAVEQAKQEVAASVQNKMDEEDAKIRDALDKMEQHQVIVDTKISAATREAQDIISTKTGQLDAKYDTVKDKVDEATGKIDGAIASINEFKDNINSTVTEINTKVADNATAIEANTNAIADVNTALDNKVDKTEVYTKDEVYAKDEVYNKSEADDAIADSAQATLSSINSTLNEVLGNTEGSDQASLAETLGKTQQLIKDFDAKVSEKISTAIAEEHDAVIEDAKSDILSVIDVEKLDDIATSNDIATVNDKIDSEITTVNESIEQVETSVANTKTALEEKISEAKVELNDKITTNAATALTNLTNATTDLTNTMNSKQAELVTAIEKVDSEYKTADTEIKNLISSNQSALNVSIATKADAESVYSKEEVDDKLANIDIRDSTYSKEEIDAELANKANISDVYKYTKSQIEETLSDKQEALGYNPEDSANKNVANGYAGLDSNGKISIDQLPDIAKQATYVVTNADERLAITDLVAGTKAFETVTGDSYIYDGTKWVLSAASNWENINLDFNNITNVPTTVSGYGITDAYTKTDINNLLNDKADKDHGHNASDIVTDDTHRFMTDEQIASIADKANKDDVYTKTVADTTFVNNTAFNTKIAAYSTTDEMNTAITDAVAPLAKSDEVFTKDEVRTALAEKADQTTVEEIDAKFADYATAESLTTKAVEINGNIVTLRSDINTALEAKADKDTVTTDIDTAKTDVLISVDTKLAEYDKSTVVDSKVVTAKEETLTEVDTKLAEYDKSSVVDTKVTSAKEAVEAQITTLDGKVDTVDAKFADYTTTNDLNTALAAKADATNVYAKTETYTQDETNEAIETSISAALQSVNSALATAAGEDVSGSTSAELTTLISKTAELIGKLNTTLTTSISETATTADTNLTDKAAELTEAINTAKTEVINTVTNTTIQTVINDAVGTTNISDLASKSDVTTAIDAVNEQISTINTNISGKQDTLTFTPEDSANKNTANGYAGLDNNGKISYEMYIDNNFNDELKGTVLKREIPLTIW